MKNPPEGIPEAAMFCVIFEVRPKPAQWEAYLGHAGLLRPELIRMDGFIDNVRYASKRRPGVLLSVSVWRDEKALIRWRTHALHHGIQEKGRMEVFSDYHLRVGEIAADGGHRADMTETGTKLVTLVEARLPAGLDAAAPPEALAAAFGIRDLPCAPADWDVFEAILTPGDMLLLLSWRDFTDAEAAISAPGLRQVRIVRDYGMADRHEAPQYYPPVPMRV